MTELVVWSVDRIALSEVTVGDYMLMARPLEVTSVEHPPVWAGGGDWVTVRWADDGPGLIAAPAGVIATVLRRRQMSGGRQ